MKFAILARILDYEGFGVQTHLTGLLQGISKIDHSHQIVLLVGPSQIVDLNKFSNRFEVVQIGPSPKNVIGRLLWDHIFVGRICQQLKIDALYAPAHVRPAYIPCPTVVFVPDMMYHLFPEQWSLSDRLYFVQAVNHLTSRSEAVIALSENTKQDLLSNLKIPAERVTVVYPGLPEGFFHKTSNETGSICLKYGLKNPFLLFVGSFHPRKNIEGILAAFERIGGQIPHDLVLVGPPAWCTPKIRSRLENSPFKERIRTIGLVPRSELPLFYNQADLFIFPTFYEGFGFPILEALSCGCPTVTSNISSLPEVVGDAAILVNPANVQEIADAVCEILENKNLRNDLKARSILRCKKFSWKETAKKTMELVESVVST